MAHEYLDLEDLKNTLSLGGSQTYADDDLEAAIAAASRGIDKHTRRRFWADADASQVRYYTPDSAREVPIDDLITLTRVDVDTTGDGTFATQWTLNTDFVTEPLNAAADGEPYTLLKAHRRAGRGFPNYERSVKVTGKFGWLTTPPGVIEATSIIAAQLARRARMSSGGTTTFDGKTVTKMIRTDLDLAAMLDPYTNWAG